MLPLINICRDIFEKGNLRQRQQLTSKKPWDPGWLFIIKSINLIGYLTKASR